MVGTVKEIEGERSVQCDLMVQVQSCRLMLGFLKGGLKWSDGGHDSDVKTKKQTNLRKKKISFLSGWNNDFLCEIEDY